MSFFIAFLRYYYYNVNVYLSKRGQNMIEFKNVYKTYSTGTEAVNNANFKIEKGEFAFLVGASGSRKINSYKANIKRRRTNIRKYNYKWKRYNFFKTKKSTIFKKKYGSCFSRF